MKHILARNVNEAYVIGLNQLRTMGLKNESRAGDVIVHPMPVVTEYRFPNERVLFDAHRDCNHYFHFLESLWMLAGSNSAAWVAQFNKRMLDFSDDGETLNGAYGYRWREYFGRDQLEVIIDRLKSHPNDRRIVLTMWSADDLGDEGLDFPCNTHIYFRIDNLGRLMMTVCNRSNDAIWGAYGANAVHMSMLQEYMALRIGVPVGHYYQMSNNFHAYTEVFDQMPALQPHPHDPYKLGEVRPYEWTMRSGQQFDEELRQFVEDPFDNRLYGVPLLNDIAVPMAQSWQAFKQKQYLAAAQWAGKIQASDWRRACLEWLDRKEKARNAKAD